MQESLFKERLAEELKRRRAKNRRYSLRAFALLLGADHSTVSEVLRGARRPPLDQVRGWAKKIGMTGEEAALYVASERIRQTATAAGDETLWRWISEAISLITDPAHREILRLARQPGFRADSRWIAGQAGLGVDQVNMALDRLLRFGLIEASSPGQWRDLTGLGQMTESEFRKLALGRVREKAVEARIDLRLWE